MNEWIVRICCVSVILSLLSYIIPKGRVKNLAVICMGFVFLITVIAPLSSVLNENSLFDRLKAEYTLLKKNAVSSDDETYFNDVMDEYKKRVEEDIRRAVDKVEIVKCISVDAVINKDKESDNFGNITTLYCTVAIGKGGNDENDIFKVRDVEDIVISIGGNQKTQIREDYSDIKMQIASKLVGVFIDDSSKLVIFIEDV